MTVELWGDPDTWGDQELWGPTPVPFPGADTALWGDPTRWDDLVFWGGPISGKPIPPPPSTQILSLIVEPVPGSMDDHDRPFRRAVKGQRFPGLWAYHRPPTTGRGILLWKDGRVDVVDSWDNYDLYWDADDRLAGGYQVNLLADSWQYAVLTAAGFQFADQEGNLVVPIVDDYGDTYDPIYD